MAFRADVGKVDCTRVRRKEARVMGKAGKLVICKLKYCKNLALISLNKKGIQAM